MANAKKARAVGLNHIALEVGNIDEALSFYGRIFAFELRGKSEDVAFIDLGDRRLSGICQLVLARPPVGLLVAAHDSLVDKWQYLWNSAHRNRVMELGI